MKQFNIEIFDSISEAISDDSASSANYANHRTREILDALILDGSIKIKEPAGDVILKSLPDLQDWQKNHGARFSNINFDLEDMTSNNIEKIKFHLSTVQALVFQILAEDTENKTLHLHFTNAHGRSFYAGIHSVCYHSFNFGKDPVPSETNKSLPGIDDRLYYSFEIKKLESIRIRLATHEERNSIKDVNLPARNIFAIDYVQELKSQSTLLIAGNAFEA